MIPAGKYLAKVLSHAITETKAEKEQATVVFSFEVDGRIQTLTWYGHFTEKTTDSTIKALIACGLSGNNPAGPLHIGKEVSITVEVEKDEKGRERNKIRWVNSVGGVARNVIPQDAAKARLSSLEAAVMAAREGSHDEFGF